MAKTLPRGSWFDTAPEIRARDDLGDLVIEVCQLEADLTGILGSTDRTLASGLRIVDAQLAEVDAAFRTAGTDADIQRLCAYVKSLRAAYAEYTTERTMRR
ncbi:hypothetical protein AB0F42_21725 [Streptomyces buecherae]|uniref:hypothetical protein n=1 Tax=Streptomyces buecherae TaxID=2763006 RepID=UPI00340EC816